MTTLADSEGVGIVGSINSSTTPTPLNRPTVSNGDLVLLAPFFAQLVGTNLIDAIADLTMYTSYGSSSNRLGAIFAGIVTDAAAFNAAAAFSLESNSATVTRVAGVVGAYTPDPGFEWDMGSIVTGGPEFNASSQSSDTFPTVAARTDTFGAAFTNKGSSTLLTKHVVPTGTLTIQARSVTSPSGSVSDSVASITRIPSGGGATVNFVVDDGGSTPLSQAGNACVTLTLAINQVDTTPDLPTVTEPGFGTVRKMLATRGATFAHRNLGGTYPEMTEYGARMAANAGFGCVEISCQRTSDGVWFGAHDTTPDRVAVQTTHDGTLFSALTWAQVSAMTIGVGVTGAPAPFATLQQLVETLPSDYVFLVDPKQSGDNATYRTAFLDLVDTLLGPTRAIIKLDIYAAVATFQAAQARGYKTMAYMYGPPSSESDPGVVAARMPYVDLPGLNYNATNWAAMQALYPGKKWWGHVAATQANHDEAIANGADFVQCTSVTITPTGVEAWRPGLLSDGFAPAELRVGAGLVQKVYRGSSLEWERP